MLVLITAAIAQFALAEQTDPITLESRSIYAVSDYGTVFGLTCRPGRSEIEIYMRPLAYYEPSADIPFWEARADSRFASQPRAENDAWHFARDGMYYVGQGMSLASSARFIDLLAKNDEFNIRIGLAPEDVRTITVTYSIDQARLRDFIGSCAPRRIISRLRQMNSVAAPDQ